MVYLGIHSIEKLKIYIRNTLFLGAEGGKVFKRKQKTQVFCVLKLLLTTQKKYQRRKIISANILTHSY